MENIENTSDNKTVKITMPSKIEILFWLKNQGIALFVTGSVCWVMYNMIIEDRKYREDQIAVQNKQIEDLRKVVDDCARSKKDQLTQEVQAVNIKIDKLLTKNNID